MNLLPGFHSLFEFGPWNKYTRTNKDTKWKNRISLDDKFAFSFFFYSEQIAFGRILKRVRWRGFLFVERSLHAWDRLRRKKCISYIHEIGSVDLNSELERTSLTHPPRSVCPPKYQDATSRILGSIIMRRTKRLKASSSSPSNNGKFNAIANGQKILGEQKTKMMKNPLLRIDPPKRCSIFDFKQRWKGMGTFFLLANIQYKYRITRSTLARWVLVLSSKRTWTKFNKLCVFGTNTLKKNFCFQYLQACFAMKGKHEF